MTEPTAINTTALTIILYRRGHFRIDARLARRAPRTLLAR